MYVSNVANLKVGDGYLTPGQPVEDFRKWAVSAQENLLRLRRVVDVTADVAEDMRKEYAEKDAKAKQAKLRQQFDRNQAAVRTLSRQIATSKEDTINKVSILEEAERKSVELAEKLGLPEDQIEFGLRPPPKQSAEFVPLVDVDPQTLANMLADLSDIDLRNWAAENIDYDGLREDQDRAEMLSAIFERAYGKPMDIPAPKEKKPGDGIASPADLVAYRKRLAQELGAMSNTQLKKLAKENKIDQGGSRVALAKRMMQALEQAEIRRLGR